MSTPKRFSRPLIVSLLAILVGCHSHEPSASQAEAPSKVVGPSNPIKGGPLRPEIPEANWESVSAYTTQSTPPPTEIQTIRGRCAVLIYPSDAQIKSTQAELGDSDAETVGDDGSFYMSGVITSLKAKKVPRVVAKRRYLRLPAQGGMILDIRKEGAPYFNILLCSTTKAPVFRSPIDANEEFIEAYFKATPSPRAKGR